jgi:hypothetical protein
MAFKPAGTQSESPSTGPSVDWTAVNKQVRGGNRPARISLIVDLGTQKRDNFVEEYSPTLAKHIKALEGDGFLTEEDGKQFINIPQTDQPQIAVFADLVHDVVDFGGDLGKQPYRLSLNGSDFGNMRGIGFSGCYSFDKNGQILKDKGFTFHSMSPLTKLAKATKQEQIISGSGKDNMDVEQLLGKACMVQVQKSEPSEDKCYLNYKGCSEVPMVASDPSDPDSEEVPMTIKPLQSEALIITFDNVTEDSKKWLRGDLIKKIKEAVNYQGSNMQKVLEGGSGVVNTSQASPEGVQEEVVKQPPKAKAKPAKAVVEAQEDDLDSDCPF